MKGDDIKGDENKIERLLKDIGYKQRGDTKSDRSKLIGRMLASVGEPTSQIASPKKAAISEEEIYRHDTSDL